MRIHRYRMTPVPAMVIGVIAVSFSSIFVKWSSAPASVIGMYRLLFTVLLMLPFMGSHLQKIREMSRSDWTLVLISGISLGFHFLFWMTSLKYTTVASSMIITTLEPVFVMIGAYLVFHERTTKAALFSMIVAMVGTILIGWGDLGHTSMTIIGDVYSLLGTFSVAGYMLAGQSLRSRMPSMVYSCLVFAVATVVLALSNVISGAAFTGYSASDWEIFVLLAVVPTIFGHVLFNWLLKFVSATTVSMTVLGEPVVSIILAFLLLHEAIVGFQMIGGCLAIAGVWLFLRSSSIAKKEASDAAAA